MDTIPDRIEVTFNMTADDYSRYFAAIVSRQRSGWANIMAPIAVSFGAILVAFAFRYVAVATRLSHDSAAVDLIGLFSLAAFMLGAFAILAAGTAWRRVAFNKHMRSAREDPFGSTTVVFDATGLARTSELSQWMCRWAGVGRVTIERDLLLLWIGPSSPVVVPCRSFGDESACQAANAFVRARLSEAGSGSGSTAAAV
jgi:hypothetical protein